MFTPLFDSQKLLMSKMCSTWWFPAECLWPEQTTASQLFLRTHPPTKDKPTHGKSACHSQGRMPGVTETMVSITPCAVIWSCSQWHTSTRYQVSEPVAYCDTEKEVLDLEYRLPEIDKRMLCELSWNIHVMAVEILKNTHHWANSKGLVCQQIQNKEVEGKRKRYVSHIHMNVVFSGVAYDMTASHQAQKEERNLFITYKQDSLPIKQPVSRE